MTDSIARPPPSTSSLDTTRVRNVFLAVAITSGTRSRISLSYLMGKRLQVRWSRARIAPAWSKMEDTTGRSVGALDGLILVSTRRGCGNRRAGPRLGEPGDADQPAYGPSGAAGGFFALR